MPEWAYADIAFFQRFKKLALVKSLNECIPISKFIRDKNDKIFIKYNHFFLDFLKLYGKLNLFYLLLFFNR